MEEIWKDIKGYEGFYQVSNLGNIRSVGRNIIKGSGKYYKEENVLKLAKGKSGYYCVKLSIDGVKKTKSVHRLVAEAFIPNQNNLPCINHINEDKLDNRVENLEWCDYSYNNKYGDGNLKRTKSKIDTWKKKNTKYIAA